MVAAFPWACFFAMASRFPVPMGGVTRNAGDALFAAFIFGLCGGFPLLALLGGMGGAAAHACRFPDDDAITRQTVLTALLIAMVVVGLLSQWR